MFWPSPARCCALAALAYQDEMTVRSQCREWGMTFIAYIDEPVHDISGFLARTATGILVWSWRGTASLTDMLLDCEFRLINPMGSRWRVHDGFWHGYAATRERFDVGSWIGHPLLVVGHSLGGALATLSAYRVAEVFPYLAVRTFGSPRVGDSDFRAAYRQRVPNTIRVVHDEDLVPRLPEPLGGYDHVHGLLHLRDDGSRVGAARHFWDWLWQLDRRLIADLDGAALHAHHVALYQSALERWEAA
jgi:hypothetical protein